MRGEKSKGLGPRAPKKRRKEEKIRHGAMSWGGLDLALLVEAQTLSDGTCAVPSALFAHPCAPAHVALSTCSLLGSYSYNLHPPLLLLLLCFSAVPDQAVASLDCPSMPPRLTIPAYGNPTSRLPLPARKETEPSTKESMQTGAPPILRHCWHWSLSSLSPSSSAAVRQGTDSELASYGRYTRSVDPQRWYGAVISTAAAVWLRES